MKTPNQTPDLSQYKFITRVPELSHNKQQTNNTDSQLTIRSANTTQGNTGMQHE